VDLSHSSDEGLRGPSIDSSSLRRRKEADGLDDIALIFLGRLFDTKREKEGFKPRQKIMKIRKIRCII
jgi:hypothetical protein